MSSKVQQERYEKALKSLLRQPENKHCVHCGVSGPTYVVAKYGIFICTQCSSVQRDYARCKSVSMSKFDAEEVEAMKQAGNGMAWKTYLADWSESKLGRPTESSRDPEKLKRWITCVFEDKKYYRARSQSVQPPNNNASILPPVSAAAEKKSVSQVSRVVAQPATTPPPQTGFDPFGSLEIPSVVSTNIPQTTQQTVNSFDPFASSAQPTLPSSTLTQPPPAPNPVDDFDPFTSAPTPTSVPPSTSQPSTQTSTQSRGVALPEDMFSFAFESTNGVSTNSTANPSPPPNQIPNGTIDNFQQSFPQQQWLQNQGGQAMGGTPQQQPPYVYGKQQQFGGSHMYGNTPQHGFNGRMNSAQIQAQPQIGYYPQGQGFNGQSYSQNQGFGQPQGQGQFQYQGGVQPYPQQMHQGQQQPANHHTPVQEMTKKIDQFDFFGDLMTDIRKNNGAQSTQQMGQPKSSGNPFA